MFLIVIGLLIAGTFMRLPDTLFAEQRIPKTRLLLWHSWKGEERSALESVVADFNCRHDDMEVFAEMFLGPGAGLSERMLLSDSALPDVTIVDREEIPSLADAGRIRSLDEAFASAFPNVLKEKKLAPVARQYGTYGRTLYGLPVRLNSFVLISNVGLLEANGVSATPGDWKNLVELMQVSAGNRNEGAHSRPWVLSLRTAGSLFHILCVQHGVDLFAEDAAVDAGAIEEILRFIEGLRKPTALLPPQVKFWDPGFVGVTSGKVLFQIDDSAMLVHLMESSNTPLAVSAVPSDSPARRTYLSRSPAFVLSSTGENDKAALEFIKFFYSPENYSQLVDRFLFVSPFSNDAPDLAGAARDGKIYSQLCQAAGSAGVHTLRADTATVLPHIARVVEQLDAGLISVEQASADILKSTEVKESSPLAEPKSPLHLTWAESTRRLSDNAGSNFLAEPVRIVSARNEHEAFQLALSAERPLDDLEISISAFVSEGGEDHAIQATTYLEEDTSISTPLVSERPGPYPNILRLHRTFIVPPLRLTRLWIDLFVGDSVPEGEYSSMITIGHHGIELAQLPIRLVVISARIPATPSQPATIGLNYDLIARHYGLQKGTREYRRLVDAFYWFLVEHRLSPYEPPVPIDSPEAESYLKDKRVSVARIPFHPRDQRFKRAVILAKEGGWLDKLYSYFIDEPTYHQYRDIIRTAKDIHSLPEVPKFMVTCFPDELLFGAVDIWAIHMRFLPEGIPHGPMDRSRYRDIVDRRMTAGDTVWWYTAGAVRPFPTLQIEDDPVAFRIIPWLQQLYRINGLLQWEAANWVQPPDQPFIQSFGNGEGLLVYPDKLNPAPSIRLELLRQGLEDAEHLMLLRREITDLQEKLKAQRLGNVSSLRVAEICRRLIADEALRACALHDVILLPHFVRDPGAIEKVRLEVINETIDLARRPLALVLTEPEEKRYTDSESARIFGVAEPGCRIEINRVRVAVDESGYFSVRLPLVEGTDTFQVVLEHGNKRKVIIRKITKL